MVERVAIDMRDRERGTSFRICSKVEMEAGSRRIGADGWVGGWGKGLCVWGRSTLPSAKEASWEGFTLTAAGG